MLITKSQLRKILIEAILTNAPDGDASAALVTKTLTLLSNLTTAVTDPGSGKYLWFTGKDDKEALLPFFFGGAATDIGSVGENIVSRNSRVIGEKVFGQEYEKGRNFNTSPNPQKLDLEQWQTYGLSGAVGTFPAVDVCMWNGFNDENPFISDQMINQLTEVGDKYKLTLGSSELLATSVKFSGGFKVWPSGPGASPTINAQNHNFSEANCKELGFTCLANVAATKLERLYAENSVYIKDENSGVSNTLSGADKKIVDFLKFAHLSGHTKLNDDLIRFWFGLQTLNVIKKPEGTSLPVASDKINAYANSDDVVDQIRNGTFIQTFSEIVLPVSGYEQVILPHAPSNLGVSEAFNFPVLCAIRALPVGSLTYTVPAPSGEVVPTDGLVSLSGFDMGEIAADDIKAIGVLSKNIEDFLTNFKTSMTQLASAKSPAMGTTDRSDTAIKGSLKHKEGESLISTNIKNYINMAAVNRIEPIPDVDVPSSDGFAKVIVNKYNSLGNNFDRAVFEPLAKSISVLDSKFKDFMNSMGISNDELNILSLNAFDLFRPISSDRDDDANVADTNKLADLMNRPSQTGGFANDSVQIRALISLITLIENAAKFIANIEDAVKRLRNNSSQFKTVFTKLEGLVGKLDKDFNRRIYAKDKNSPYFILGADPAISPGSSEPTRAQRADVAVNPATRVLLRIEPFPPSPSTSTSDGSNLLSDFENILNLRSRQIASLNNEGLKNLVDSINANIPLLEEYLNAVTTWLTTASQRNSDAKIDNLVKAIAKKDITEINDLIQTLITYLSSLTYTDATGNTAFGLGDTSLLAQDPPEAIGLADDAATKTRKTIAIRSYNDSINSLRTALITAVANIQTNLKNDKILKKLTDLHDILKEPTEDSDIISDTSTGTDSSGNNITFNNPIFPSKTDGSGTRAASTAAVQKAYGDIFRDTVKNSTFSGSKIIEPLKADTKTVTQTDDDTGTETSEVTRSGAEKVFSMIKFRTVITNIEYFVNVAETVSLTADQIFTLPIPNVSSESDEEKKKAILELSGLEQVFGELQQKAEAASEDPNYVDQLQLLIANNPDAVSDIVAPKVITGVVINPSNSEALINSFIQAIEIIDICFLAPPAKDAEGNVLFSYFSDDSKRVEQRERLTKIRQTFSGKGIVTEQSKRDRSLDGKAIELITTIAGFIKLALNAYTIKNVLDVYLDMTGLIINTENFINYFEKLETVYLELSDEQVTDDIAKNNVINIQQFSKDQRSIDKKFDQGFDDSSMTQITGIASEGRRLKMKYSLLDLLEEQMVPMPALGAGSAQYDSRRVEDPFDIDPRTMSLLGLLDAGEVNINATDVDTDLDGIPNDEDPEDDTLQGFGDVMERFLRNTHQKEDNYKKEKQECQFGLSHAALLKKKYYGRY